MTRSKTRWFFLGSAFVLLLAGVTPAAYAHGGDPSLIHACVNNHSGEVKIVGANASCKQHETAVDWAITAPSGAVPKVLTEISLVSVLPAFANASPGEKSRFLWEPNRYDPAPVEIFFEVVAAVVIGGANASATFRLHDVTNDVPIADSSLTIVGSSPATASGARLRTGNLALSFPGTSAEIALVVELSEGAGFSIQRSAVLVQQ